MKLTIASDFDLQLFSKCKLLLPTAIFYPGMVINKQMRRLKKAG